MAVRMINEFTRAEGFYNAHQSPPRGAPTTRGCNGEVGAQSRWRPMRGLIHGRFSESGGGTSAGGTIFNCAMRPAMLSVTNCSPASFALCIESTVMENRSMSNVCPTWREMINIPGVHLSITLGCE